MLVMGNGDLQHSFAIHVPRSDYARKKDVLTPQVVEMTYTVQACDLAQV